MILKPEKAFTSGNDKSAEEIVRGLRHIAHGGFLGANFDAGKAADLIESQAAEIAAGKEANASCLEHIKSLKAQRSALKESNDGLCVSHDNLYARLIASDQRGRVAVEDLELAARETQGGVGVCVVCKHYPMDMSRGMPSICDECAGAERCMFEWRGPQEAGEDRPKPVYGHGRA